MRGAGQGPHGHKGGHGSEGTRTSVTRLLLRQRFMLASTYVQCSPKSDFIMYSEWRYATGMTHRRPPILPHGTTM